MTSFENFADDREVWSRQPSETDAAFQAFVVYRSMPNRTLERVGEKMDRTASGLANWSHKNRWPERAAAYDQRLDEEQTEGEQEARRLAGRSMVARHKKMGELGVRIATVELARHARALGADGPNPSIERPPTLSIDAIGRLSERAVKIERVAHGEPDEIQEVRGGASWTKDIRAALEADRRAAELAKAADSGAQVVDESDSELA